MSDNDDQIRFTNYSPQELILRSLWRIEQRLDQLVDTQLVDFRIKSELEQDKRRH